MVKLPRAARDRDAATERSLIQVAFAGHARPRDLGQHEPASRALAAAFALIRAAGVGEARLLTGLASGADQLAAEAWRGEGLGPIHAVMPHLGEAPGVKTCAADVATRQSTPASWIRSPGFAIVCFVFVYSSR